MINVGMAVEQDPNVLESEAELAHTVADQGDRRLEAAVDEDVALRRRDQERGDVRGADVRDIADQPERLERAVHHPEGALDRPPRDSSGGLLERGAGVGLLPPDGARRQVSDEDDGQRHNSLPWHHPGLGSHGDSSSHSLDRRFPVG